jgi:hypothetical protein
MSDFLFGVLCGGSFMLPGFALGYAAAMKRGWKREDELRQRLEENLDRRMRELRGAG